jgi:hypothetical protein
MQNFTVNYIGKDLDNTSCSVSLLPVNPSRTSFDKLFMLNSALYLNAVQNKIVGEIFYTCSAFPTIWNCNGVLNLDLGPGKRGTIQHTFSFKPQDNSIVVPEENIKSDIICGSGDFLGAKGYLDVTFEKNNGRRIMKIYYTLP